MKEKLDRQIVIAPNYNQKFRSFSLDAYCTVQDRHTTSQHQSWPYQFGFFYGGWVLWGFISWLIEEMTRENIEHVYFLARDGWSMKRVYDAFRTRSPHLPPSSYLYASRQALGFPLITSLNEEWLTFLTGGLSRVSALDVLERSHIRDLGHQRELESRIRQTLTKPISSIQKEIISMFLKEHAEIIVKEAELDRKVMQQYLAQKGFFSHTRTAIVDIGWHGSMQHYLQSYVQLHPSQSKLFGYYIGKRPSRWKHGDNGHIRGYLFNDGQPSERFQRISTGIEVMELLFGAPHPGIFSVKSDGLKFRPEYEENHVEDEKSRLTADISQGILDFTSIALETHATHVTPANVSDIFLSLVESPTPLQAILIGEIAHGDGTRFSHNMRYLCRPPHPLLFFINPAKYRRAYDQAYWKAGYKKILNMYKRPYQLLANTLRKTILHSTTFREFDPAVTTDLEPGEDSHPSSAN